MVGNGLLATFEPVGNFFWQDIQEQPLGFFLFHL